MRAVRLAGDRGVVGVDVHPWRAASHTLISLAERPVRRMLRPTGSNSAV
jgi:hypothetical protein